LAASDPDRRKLHRKLRIMIVDDSWDTVQTLMEVLRFEGHEVWALYRASQVVQGVGDFDPDVLILDIGLPDGSGFALARDIRERHGPKRPLLIAITGLYKRGPEAKDFDHFILKPFAFDDLAKLLAPLRNPEEGKDKEQLGKT
jgi:DNA-binding response OmpR family regulator